MMSTSIETSTCTEGLATTADTIIAATESSVIAGQMLVEDHLAENGIFKDKSATACGSSPAKEVPNIESTESNQDETGEDVFRDCKEDAEVEPTPDAIVEACQELNNDDIIVGEVLDSVVNNSSSQETEKLFGGLNDYLVYDDDEATDNYKENRAVALTDGATDETDMNGVEDIDIGMDQHDTQADQIYAMKDSAQTQEGKEAEVFVVEKILDKKIGTNGSIKYLVKWLNYPSKDNSWEPLDNLIDCNEAMIKFELERAKKIAKRHEIDDNRMEADDQTKNKYSKRLEYEVNDIMGLVKLSDERYFLTSLANSTKKAFVRASLANAIFPTKVIDFYIKNLQWKTEIES